MTFWRASCIFLTLACSTTAMTNENFNYKHRVAIPGFGRARRGRETLGFHSQKAIKIRGGDIGTITSKSLAKGFIGLVSLDAITGTIFPSKCLELFGLDAPKKSLRRFTMEGVGGLAGGVVITSILALTSEKPVEKIIAFGLLSPLFFFLRTSLSNPDLTLTKPSMVLWGLMTMALIGLNLFDIASTKLAMKWIFGLDAALSAVSYFDPKIGSKLTGIDPESEGELTLQFFRVLFGYETVFSVLCFLLLNGVEPVKALGYVAAIVTAWVFEMGMVSKIQDYLPNYWWLNNVTYVLMMIILGGLSIGMLQETSLQATA